MAAAEGEQAAAASLSTSIEADDLESGENGQMNTRPVFIQSKTASPSFSTLKTSKFIKAGDLVIIFMSRDKPPVSITVTPGHESTNTYGSFSHDNMIGLPFGAKLASRNARGFIHLLRPNPELWTLALPHRTQIVYTPDMSFIAAQLGITPGARIIEAGTGSGSFSHYLTRTVARNHVQSRGHGWQGKEAEQKGQDQRNGRGRGRLQDDREKEDLDLTLNDSEEELSQKQPSNKEEAETMHLLSREPDAHVDSKDGRVWSFEFHAGRAVKAWDEFQYHGLFPTLSLRHRNVCKMGFGLQGVADAVFLDLPAPWEALEHAAKALRSDVAGRICCFSPCIEQVLRTVEAFRKGSSGSEGDADTRWVDIETYECLNRTHLSVWTGSIASIQDVITRIKTVEERKGKRREAQIARVKKERQDRLATSENDKEVQEREGGMSVNGDKQTEEVVLVTPTAPTSGEKRKREDDDEKKSTETSKAGNSEGVRSVLCKDGKTLYMSNVSARSLTEMKGHTSYLTFATLLPRTIQPNSFSSPQPSRAEERQEAQEVSTQSIPTPTSTV